MKLLPLLLTAAVAFGQSIDLTRNTRGTLPETKGGTGTAPSGTLPALCSTGRIFFKTNATSGQKIYGCESTNTWIPQGGAGGTPAFSSILAGTNTAALIVGTLGSLNYTGSGTINASHLGGVAASLFAPLASPVFTGAPTIPTGGWTFANHAHLGATTGGALTESALGLTDNVINDCNAFFHGFTPKAPGDANKFLNGVCGWAFAPGGGGATRLVVPFNAGAPAYARAAAIMEYELTLTAAATATTSGFAAADLFSTKLCFGATVYTYTAPAGFSAMAAPLAYPNTCTKQWAYWDGTNANPLGSASSDAGPDEIPTTAAPTGNPAAGKVWNWADSTALNLMVRDSAGNVNHGVRTKAVVGGNCITGIADDGTTSTGACSGGGGTPGGATTQVQRNLAGAFSGDSGFVYDGAGGADLSSALRVGVPGSYSYISQFNVLSQMNFITYWQTQQTCSSTVTLQGRSRESILLTGNCTASLAASQMTRGQEMTIKICQDATGGRTFTWPSSGTVFLGGMTIGATATASKCSVQSFVVGDQSDNIVYATSPGVINQ